MTKEKGKKIISLLNSSKRFAAQNNIWKVRERLNEAIRMVKECDQCDGTGIRKWEHDIWGDTIKHKESCGKCQATGKIL